jgi:hypothetical protein
MPLFIVVSVSEADGGGVIEQPFHVCGASHALLCCPLNLNHIGSGFSLEAMSPKKRPLKK